MYINSFCVCLFDDEHLFKNVKCSNLAITFIDKTVSGHKVVSKHSVFIKVVCFIKPTGINV